MCTVKVDLKHSPNKADLPLEHLTLVESMKIPPKRLLTHPNYKTDRPIQAVYVMAGLSRSVCLGIQPTAEQFTSALIATASTAGPNGVHDREI